MKLRNRSDELRHREECAGLQTAHQADMTAIEEKHQVDLAETQRKREEDRVRHQDRMAAMNIRQTHETHTMEVRQMREVDELGRANDAKKATQTADMRALKGRNQSKMDHMCRIMHRTQELEEKLEASTVRYFELSRQVNHERAEMRRCADLEVESEKQLMVQMKHIDALQREVAAKSWKKYARGVDDITSLEKLYPLLDKILAAQEKYRRRVGHEVTSIADINGALLTKHQ